jgi:hypothetical protein
MESLPQKQNVLYCRDCGADINPQAVRCWCCSKSFPEASGARQEAFATEVVDERADETRQRMKYFLGVAAALLLATLAEVLFFGIFVKNPGLGIAIVIFLTPVLIRVGVMAVHAGSGVNPSSPWVKIAIVHVWILMGGAVLIAAFVTFLLTCKFHIN